VFLAQQIGFLAQDDTGGGEGGGLLVPLLMIVGLFAIFYFLLIRPQRRRRDQQARLQSELAVGDEVVTIGGLYGTVAELDDKTVILETSDGVYSRYARAAISQVTTSHATDTDADSDAIPEITNPVDQRDTKD
jgi:preprotein translocase subunit YajC